MYATGAGETHKVQSVSGLLGVGICALDFWVVHNGAVGNGAVDFYQVLIDNASGADIEVTYLAVTHLTVRQSDVFARSLKFGVRIFFNETVPIWFGCLVYSVAVVVGTDAPAVQNHQ